MRTAARRAITGAAAALLLLGMYASSALAAGPILVNGAGEPLVWTTLPVPFNPDRGSLGQMSNATAIARVTADAALWAAVTTSTVSLANAGQLPVDVGVGNYDDYLFVCGDGLNPIVFDDDGSITDDLYGNGANEHVIGFAAIACGTYVPPVANEGVAVLNGRFLDGVSSPTNPELTPAQFDAVMTHELGHYLGLDHSQIGLAEAFDGNGSNDDALATMFPILVNGVAMSSLHLDDQVSISTLYPDPSFTADFGTITGTIFLADGVTPFQGANVIARRVGDPTVTAVSNVSGARFFPGVFGGPPPPALQALYELRGLPPGSYTVEIESVYANFQNGSSVGPFEIPSQLPGPPEFWNDANEAGADPPDNITDAVAIAIAAGATVSDIDVVINQGPIPPNDECAAPTEIASVPFSDTLDTTGATHGAFDPLQSCSFLTPQQNERSVWYRYVAPADGVVSADTIGTNYDTLLSAYTGACGGGLTEQACSDDGDGLQSALKVAVTAGTTYLFEVTSYYASGGTLHFALDFQATASCAAAPLGGCRLPALPGKSSLRVKGGSDPAKHQLQWKWSKGTATSLTDFGDPTTDVGTSYALCLYDGANAFVTATLIPTGGLCAGRDCWRAAGTGFKYKDNDRTPNGVRTLDLGAGTNTKARINLKASGSLLAVPPLPAPSLPLTMQLVNSDGICWQVTYPATGVQRNDDTQLKAHD